MSKEEKKNIVHIMSMLPCDSCHHKKVCRFNEGLKEDSFELPPKEKYPFLKISFDCTEYDSIIDFSEEVTDNTEPDEIEDIDFNTGFDVEDPFN